MEVLAETQTFAEKAGIGAEAAQNFIKGTSSYDLYGIVADYRFTDFLPVPGYVPLYNMALSHRNADLSPCSPMGYGNKMLNDLFDGTKGFAIDGAIKDAS